MRLRTFIVGFACGCTAMGFAAMTLAPKQDPADMEKMWQEALEKYVNPAEQHAELAKREGEWTADLKMWMAPGMPPEISSGHTNFKMIMGGHYLFQEYSGEYNGMPFEGAGLTAYDRMKKKYINVWGDHAGDVLTLHQVGHLSLVGYNAILHRAFGGGCHEISGEL